MGHEQFCNCLECRKAFFKKYNVNYMYIPLQWRCKNKETKQATIVTARLAKEARDIASQTLKTSIDNISASRI